MMNALYNQIDLQRKEGKKSLAVLVDPDKTSPAQCVLLAQEASISGVDFFFVGSSIQASVCIKRPAPIARR